MDMEKILSLFTLFSGETDTDKYYVLIESAAAYVKSQLLKTVYESDTRIPFYVASLANLSYTRIYDVKIHSAQTYAGSIAELPSEKTSLRDTIAVKLCKSYRALCSDILKDNTFYFISSTEAD